MAAQARAVERVIEPTPVIEGAGVRLRRSIATATLDYLDPFLLLDNFGSDDPDDYLAGFPWHPHRGIETVTYMLAGEVDHRDSIGNAGMIGAGRRAVDDGRRRHHARGDAAARRRRAHGRLSAVGQPPGGSQDDAAALPGPRRGPDPRSAARRRQRHPRDRRRGRRRERRGHRDLRRARVPGRVAAGRRHLRAAGAPRARGLRLRVRGRGPVRRGLRPGVPR